VLSATLSYTHPRLGKLEVKSPGSPASGMAIKLAFADDELVMLEPDAENG
jgi:hypothetical protein